MNEFTKNEFNYMDYKKRTLCEKLFWTIIYLTLLVICGISMLGSYEKWKSAPLINIVDEHPSHISDIPFPAITLCPTTKFDNEKFEFSKVFQDALFGHDRLAVDE